MLARYDEAVATLASVASEVVFLRSEVLPLVHRRLTGRIEGDTAEPKWPEPVRPADGLQRLARTRGHRRQVPA
ncbi:hypothetical protein GCM10028777_13540 [Angustibacter speluncae]